MDVKVEETPTSSNRPNIDSVDFSDIKNLFPGLSQSLTPQGDETVRHETGETAETVETTETAAEGKAEEPPPPPLPGKPQLTRHKTIRAFYDEGDPLEIPSHYKVEHKVNGQPVTYTVQELLDKASGVDNLDRLYTEYKKEKESFEGQRTNFKTYIGNFVSSIQKASEEGDNDLAIKAIYQLVADSGSDPVTFHRSMTNSVLRNLHHHGYITDDQLEAIEQSRRPIELEQENEYYRSKLERQAQLERQKAEQGKLGQIKAQVEQKYAMPPGAYDQTYDFLLDAQKRGELKVDKILPEDVGYFYETNQQSLQVARVLDKVAPELKSNAEVVGILLNAVRTFKSTPDELEDVLKDYLGKKPAKSESKSSSDESAVRAKNLNEKIPLAQRQATKPDERTKDRPQRRRPIEGWDDL